MEKIQLGDICEIINGFAFESSNYVSSGIRIIRISNVQKGYIEDNNPAFYPSDSNGLDKYLLEEGDLLVSLTGNVGRVAVLEKRFLPAALNQRVACLRPKTDKLLKGYLFHILNNNHFERQCIQASNGVAQKNLSTEWLKSYKIDLCDVETQERMERTLNIIRDIIAHRKSELSKLDTLVKSRFIEMFGDPVTNPMGWSKPFVENVVSSEKNALKAGPFGSSLKKEYYVKSGYKIYGQEQVISGDSSFGDYYIDEERFKMLENCSVQAGDVLISLVGTYGKLLIIPDEYEPGIINPRLMKITFDKGKVNPIYFKFFFQSDSLKKFLSENTHGGTMDILNLGIVKRIPIPVPPIALQNQFATFVQQVDKSKSVLQKLLEKQELLQAALMQEYFG